MKTNNKLINESPLIQHGNSAIHVNRLEVINHCGKDTGPFGRMLTLYKSMGHFNQIELDYQDGGETLKIFLT